MYVTYTTAHGNTGSPTHWARPGIELTSSGILVGLISSASQWELPNSDSFISSFPIWMSFASLSCLMLYLRLPILCWIKWQGWASMFFFFTNLRGKAFIIVECDVSCGLVICMLTLCSGMFHLCPLHWEFFIISGYWILSSVFHVSIEMVICFLSFFWLMWYITLFDLWMSNDSCIPAMNPTRS